jgi:hypothetical protein
MSVSPDTLLAKIGRIARHPGKQPDGQARPDMECSSEIDSRSPDPEPLLRVVFVGFSALRDADRRTLENHGEAATVSRQREQLSTVELEADSVSEEAGWNDKVSDH